MFCYDGFYAGESGEVTGGYVHTRTDGQNLNGFNAKYGYTPDESDFGCYDILNHFSK